MRIKRSD